MSISGYGLTLAGTALGAFAGVESVTVGGLELSFDEIATIDAYRTGTATFVNASDQVAGSGTAWDSTMVGRQIQLDADATLHTIESVEAADSLTLTAVYSDTGGAGAYTIMPSRIAENCPTGVREQPIEVVFEYNKTVYDTLRDASLAQTEDAFTLTDVESSTHIGDGFVASVGNVNLDSAGHAKFTATLRPQTQWAFTAGA